MAGSLLDLAAPQTRLPSELILDSGVVIHWLTAVGWHAAPVPPSPLQLGARRLVGRLVRTRSTGLVTPTGLSEVFHFVLKTGFHALLSDHQPELVARYPRVRRHEWYHLFKTRSDLMTLIEADLDRIRRLMVGNRLLVLQPADLGGIPSGRTLDDELVRTMGRYQFDSNDAAILIEARRAGVAAVASSDADFRRARLDFDVYTWLDPERTDAGRASA